MVKKTLWYAANHIFVNVVSSWLINVWHVVLLTTIFCCSGGFYFLSCQKTTVIYPAARGLFHLNINRVCLEALAEMTDAVVFLQGTVSAKYIGCFFRASVQMNSFLCLVIYSPQRDDNNCLAKCQRFSFLNSEDSSWT